VDISETLAPRSDQLNADDLIAGPITITITAIKKGSAEQPVEVHWHGGDGRPYKPSKSMRRVLSYYWSAQSAKWVGRSLTLYRDASIKYGGMEVGGIRISHLSHIENPKPLALTVTRGKRVPYTVQPLRQQLMPPADGRGGNDPAQGMDALTECPSPEALDFQRAEGAAKAALGMEELKLFWMTRTSAEKAALKTELEKDWKPAAAKADEAKTAKLEQLPL